jgi:hypothetical protein|tara:strand:- start:37 stop:1056 length:1020 start_codon:yes stop_codon:yes gene_type:complete
MIINKKTFVHSQSADLSFLRFTNRTTLTDAEVVVYDFHEFVDMSHKQMRKINRLIREGKLIYIDSTWEREEMEVLEKIDTFPEIGSIHYFYNPRHFEKSSKDPRRALLLKLIQRGLVCVAKQYFINYANIYKPAANNTPMPNKSYLCLTGKVNPIRTFLITLLSRYKLLQHGHVSYFGENHTDPSFEPLKINEFNNAEYLSRSAKELIRKELTQIKLPIIADVNKFDAKISWTKEFNAELYNAVDFVIVVETFGCTNSDDFFPTEKTAKCILMNKKFIPIASKGFLRKLKSYYTTEFNKDISHLTDWCDTSFDDLSSLEERVKRVVEVTRNEISKTYVQ